MAIYSLNVGVISRGKRGGTSGKEFHATAAAAYRAGELIRDARTGEVFDYTRKGGVWHREIAAPDQAPAWMTSRAALWNGIEAGENRSDAQLARAFMGALPHELNHEQRLELVRGFVRDELTGHGMVADFAIHAPDREGDQRNWHFHALATMRRVDGDGFAATKARDWNRKELLQHWREAWEEHCNAALEDAGSRERIDHRSNAARGIDKEPTTHLGHATTQYERGGMPTARGDLNRDIRAGNAELDQLVEELAEIDRKIAAAEQRRLEARFGRPGPDPYADALARQFGPPPELAPGIEAELAARFGDELPRARDLAQLDEEQAKHSGGDIAREQPDPTLQGPQEAPRTDEDSTAPRRISAWGYAWRAFADRARAWTARLAEYWREESSGGGGAEPEPAREPEAGPGGWQQRLAHWGHRLFLRHENQAADLETHAEAPPPDPERDPRDGRLWAEKVEQEREQQAKEPDERAPERPAAPLPDTPDGIAWLDTLDELAGDFDANSEDGGGDDAAPPPGEDIEPREGPEPDDGPDLG